MGYPVDRWELVHIEDPNYADAQARSQNGSVAFEPPPPGVKWRWESVPEADRWIGTEASEALNAIEWRDLGFTGAGVKVAVFDLEWFGAQLDPAVLGPVQTHDCWFTPTCLVPMDTLRPRFSYEEGDHGYACAQVIHDIAPDAELHLVRVNGDTTLDAAVDWALREGIDVVSMSLSFFGTSFYDGSGPLSTMMQRLNAGGTQMVVSAGNYAKGHWIGAYTDGNADGRMDGDGDDGWWVYLRAGGSRRVYVSWNQYHSCGLTDLDARVVGADGAILARAEARQIDDGDQCDPQERLAVTVPADGWYRLEVYNHAGSTTNLTVKILAVDGTVENGIAEGSVTDPGSNPEVFTVGAVRAEGYLTNDAESFSSRGPTSAGVAKPDIAGPDGVSTEAYGPEAFYGTSASTPAVAAAIALVMSSDPSLTPREAADRLQGWALSDSATFDSPDTRFGSGKARLPVTGDEPAPCGHRPLVMPLLFAPLAWRWRRRQV